MMITRDRTQDILMLLAVWLLQQESNLNHNNVQPVSILHPQIKRAWEYICLCAYLNGFQAPQTITEFVAWLHVPVEEWPILGEHCLELDLSGNILEENDLSSQFRALAEPLVKTYRPYLELEDGHFRQIYDICQQAGDEQSYTAIRLFLNQNPIHHDLYAIEDPPWQANLESLLVRCYEPIPLACIRSTGNKRYVVTCPHCGWPLLWNKFGEATCHEGGICEQLYHPLAEYESVDKYCFPYTDGMVRTKQGIQRYVVAPEVMLLELHNALNTDSRVQLHLFPGLDSYDLLINMPDGQRWAVDVKDWENAVSLAIGVVETRFRYLPPWDKAFYVVPDYRANPAYLNEFKNRWIPQNGVEFLSQSQFLRRVKEVLG